MFFLANSLNAQQPAKMHIFILQVQGIERLFFAKGNKKIMMNYEVIMVTNIAVHRYCTLLTIHHVQLKNVWKIPVPDQTLYCFLLKLGFTIALEKRLNRGIYLYSQSQYRTMEKLREIWSEIRCLQWCIVDMHAVGLQQFSTTVPLTRWHPTGCVECIVQHTISVLSQKKTFFFLHHCPLLWSHQTLDLILPALAYLQPLHSL